MQNTHSHQQQAINTTYDLNPRLKASAIWILKLEINIIEN
jgi:hypothetical protein